MFVSYGLWWYKPYDIEIPIRVPCKKLGEEEEKEYKQMKTNALDNVHPLFFLQVWKSNQLTMKFSAYHTPTFKYGALASSGVFGAIHCRSKSPRAKLPDSVHKLTSFASQ